MKDFYDFMTKMVQIAPIGTFLVILIIAGAVEEIFRSIFRRGK
jgi:hypothetical protein